MAEQIKTEQGDLRDAPRLAKIAIITGTFALVAVAIALGWVLGSEIAQDEWSLLVTASGLVTYTIVAFIDARVGFLLWVVTAPFSRFVHLDLDLGRGIPNITLSRVMTGVLLVLLLAQLATRRRKLAHITWADGLALAFVGAMALSIPNSLAGPQRAIQTFYDYIVTPLAVYFLARNFITNYRELRFFMHAMIIVGVYMGVMATHEQLTGDVWFYVEDRSLYYTASLRRVVGLLGNPAFVAICSAMGVPWAWHLFLSAKRRRPLYLLLLLTMVAGVFFCMNRSAWIGLALSFVTMAIFVKRFRGVFLLLLALGIILTGVYWALIMASPVVRERLQAQGPIDYRREAWRVSIAMIRDHPVFGVGYENYRFFYQRYGHWDTYLRNLPSPHNTYLWVWVTAGVVAFVPFMLFLAALCLSALGVYFRARDDDDSSDAELAGVFLASLVGVLAPAFVMDILAGNYNTMLMFMVMGAYSGYVTGKRQLVQLRRPGFWRSLLLETAG